MPTVHSTSRRAHRSTSRPASRFAAALVLAVPFAVTAPAVAASDSTATRHADAASACALPGATGWTDEGHDTDYAQFQRPRGHIRVAMLFVDFPDAPATGDTSGYYDFLAPAARYMSDLSYGKVHLDITPISHWLRMPQDSSTYGFQRGITWDQQALYIKQAGEAAAPYTDLSAFDMIYVVPTKNASAITFSPAYIYDPSHPNLVVNGKEMKWGVTLGQDMYHWGPKVADHETSHTFGLPYLYSFSGDVPQFFGGFDLMG
ncbi:MAG: peptidase M6, partial [Catenulispora sp.]|nr:peptidase M6 [Catenulispora sp.]